MIESLEAFGLRIEHRVNIVPTPHGRQLWVDAKRRRGSVNDRCCYLVGMGSRVVVVDRRVLWGRRTLAMAVHTLVLNLQSFVSNLKPIHLLDSRLSGHDRVIRNEACETIVMLVQCNTLVHMLLIYKTKHLPNPLLSPVYLSTYTLALITLPNGLKAVAKSASVRSCGKW